MAQVAFGVTAVLPGGDDLFLTGVTDLTMEGDVLYVVSSAGGGGVAAYRLQGGRLVSVDRMSAPGQPTPGVSAELQILDLDGSSTALVTGVAQTGLWAVQTGPSGDLVVPVSLGPAAGLPDDLRVATAVVQGPATYVYGAELGSETILVWQVAGDGTLVQVAAPAASGPASAGTGVSAMETVTRGGTTFLLAASDATQSLTSYRIGSDGRLTQAGRIGAETGLGIAAPQDLAVIAVAGQSYVVMASAGTGTLTVAVVAADGSLTVTDHLMDTRDTRFQGADVVEAITIDGRSYVVAAGSDDGVTLFELLPGGRLLLRGSLADTTGTTLDNVSSLALDDSGGDLHILVSSASEPGVTWLTVDLDPVGAVRLGTASGEVLNGTGNADLIDGGAGGDTLFGGNGADILIDGAGSDTMTGGAGADIFVLAADGAVDRITDIDPTQDQIDLSGWPLLRSTDQLLITPTGTGAEIRFGDEVLILTTVNAQSLSSAAVLTLVLVGPDRLLPDWTGPIAPPEPLPAVTVTPGTPLTPGTTGIAGGAPAPSPPSPSPSPPPPGEQISGGGGRDTLVGGDGSDTLYAGGSDDILYGGAGDDTLYGGNGADLLSVVSGRNTLYGEAGNDTLYGGGDDDFLFGGDGDDHLDGRGGFDTLFGGNGDDTLIGDIGRDVLWGEAGADWIEGVSDIDTIYGGDGDDSLFGNSQNDLIHGDAGNDYIDGGQGYDILWGGAGNDLIVAKNGYDTLYGGNGADTLHGNAGADLVYGGGGDDYIVGGINFDTLYGDAGNDLIEASNGHDTLYGGKGNDTLFGNSGFDTLYGGKGRDTLSGGQGKDCFVFIKGDGADRITDFSDDQDTLMLDAALWGGRDLSVDQILGMARVSGGDVIFDFGGGDVLTIEALGDPGRLANDLDIL